MAGLDSDGADNESEWAANILKSIGITPENPDGLERSEPHILVPPVIAPPIIAKPHPNVPMPCCERAETRGPNCFVPIDQVPDFKSNGW